MSDDQACQTPLHERIESNRKCWWTGCKKTAILEWCGWRWCFGHWRVSKAGYGNYWIAIKYTHVIWRNLNPFRAWRRRQRRMDVDILWPTCKILANGDLTAARHAFYLHANMDRAWNLDYSYDELCSFIQHELH